METGGRVRTERRLAAILAADVAGYSRLIGADEEGTLARLKSIRAEVIDPKINEHLGRLVKTTGDGLLVEFGSVVDALRCATEVATTCVTPSTASFSCPACDWLLARRHDRHSPPRRNPRSRCRRLFSPYRDRRGGHPPAAQVYPRRGDRPEDRRASRSAGQNHWRWPTRRIRQCCRCPALRDRSAARNGSAQFGHWRDGTD